VALLVALFIVVPVIEIYVIVKVGELIGVWPTLALLLADALLGAWLLKRQGRAAWRRFNSALTERRFPGKEVADGVLILVGGALLLAPGFLTDIAGALLLIPPTRAIARSLLRRHLVGRFAVVDLGGATSAWRPSAAQRHYDFDASAAEAPIDEDVHRQLPD
jgi:UPF0716 protein FxsA